MKILCKPLITAVVLLLSTSATYAYSGDMSINSENISFSTSNFLQGQTTRIYAKASNNSTLDLLGTVRFYANGNQIGADQAISIFAGKTDGVFIDWVPGYGNHEILVKLFAWESEIDDPSNNEIVTNIFVVQDTDYDGIPNSSDDDDDNDGVKDTEDIFPLLASEQYDTDGDGDGDNRDTDDDNDGVPDEFDDLPLDPDETMDTDNDGIGNIADQDDDNDGISDIDEENQNTDPLKSDTDDDGKTDQEDPFPTDPTEWMDTDNDNIGNNSDTDDDNDGFPDETDEFPLNKGPIIQILDENSIISLFNSHTFDASPSYDEDGNIVKYNWEIDNSIEKEGNAINHVFTRTGEHTIKVTITDDKGESRTSEFQVNVINTTLYLQIGLFLAAILLALLIHFKYIAEAKNSK